VILVDSSVWIDYLTGGTSVEAEMLENLISAPNEACLCGIILQEVLQGIRDSSEFRRVRVALARFPFVEMGKETFIRAANVYRVLRRKGVKIPSGDATIAAVALQNNLALLTRDRHFEKIAGCEPLALVRAAKR
jgi:predicted nucleic acid-binding protein